MKRIFWVASYPRSGNTWMRLALASLRRGGAPVDINAFVETDEIIVAARHAFDEALGIDSADLTPAEILRARPAAIRVLARALKQPRFWKAHEAFLDTPSGEPLFPADATIQAFYIVRDPRDVALSFAAFLGKSVDETIAIMADPDATLAKQRGRAVPQLPQPLLDWSGHVASWLDRPTFPVHTIRFEDMHADFVATLHCVAAAAGLDAAESGISRAVAATRFEVLQSQEARSGFSEQRDRKAAFFRRGMAGGWRDTLTAAQTACIERDHGGIMRRLGYLGAG